MKPGNNMVILMAIYCICLSKSLTNSLETENVMQERKTVPRLKVIINGTIKFEVGNNFDNENVEYFQECGVDLCNILSQYCNQIGMKTCKSCADLCQKGRTTSYSVQKNCEKKCAGYLHLQQLPEKSQPKTTTGVTGTPIALKSIDDPEKSEVEAWLYPTLGVLGSIAFLASTAAALYFGKFWYDTKYPKTTVREEETSAMMPFPARNQPFMSATEGFNNSCNDRRFPVLQTCDESNQAPNGSVPIANGSVLLANGSLPIANGSVPLANGSLPIANGSVPIANGSVPLANGSLPIANGSVPLANGSLPIANGSVPIANGSVPLANGSVPLDNGSVPIANGSVPNRMSSPIASLSTADSPGIANGVAQYHRASYTRNHDANQPGIGSEEDESVNLFQSHGGGITNPLRQLATNSSSLPQTIAVTDGGDSTQPLLLRNQQSDGNRRY